MWLTIGDVSHLVAPKKDLKIAGQDRFRLTALTGVAALGLDAIASVAYGPEAIVVVLAAAGTAGLGATVPVTLAIVALLVVLIASYRQVITAYPDGGGAYTVASAQLGRRAGLVAAASLVVDYVLNVAVSVAAGVAALTSAFPELLSWTLPLCLIGLACVAAVNIRSIVAGAKAFAIPAGAFVVLLGVVIVIGLFRSSPAEALPVASASNIGAVGILLILSAFGNGCAALTGVEAIANATPVFRAPAQRRAKSAELALGGILGALLIGLAVLIEKFHIHPVGGRTILSLITQGSIGTGVGYLAIQILTAVLLFLAANTSFGGLPILLARMSRDKYLPKAFGHSDNRGNYRTGIYVLTSLAAVLLVFTGGNVNALVPLFAIGVFVGFLLCQIGMVRHWGLCWRAFVNGLGAVLTFCALAVVTTTKFLEGGWLIVVIIPVIALAFAGFRAWQDSDPRTS
jgi:amino acid transporter